MKFLRILPIIFIFSCSSFSSKNIAPGYLETYKTIKQALIGFEESSISREVVDSIPYASMTIKIGKGPLGLMILESIRDDEYIWVTADPIYIVLRNGRIIQTEGLGNDLKNIIYPEVDFEGILKEGYPKFRAYYSYSNPDLSNLGLEFTYSVQGKEEIIILDKSYNLTLVNERISNKQLGWDFINFYWVDEKGFVMKSVQTINPKLPKFELEVTKKPSL